MFKLEEEFKEEILEETEEEISEEEKEELEEELEEEVEEELGEQPEEEIEELVEELEEIAEDEDEIEEIEEEAVEEVVEETVEEVEEEEKVPEPEYKSEPVPEGIPEDIKKIGGNIQIILKDVDGDLIPFGYHLQKDKLVIKEDEAMKVKIVLSWFYKRDKSIEEIVGATKLSIDEIEKILINPIYFGKIYFEGALVKGNHEPILTERYCKLNEINTDEIEEKYLSTKK